MKSALSFALKIALALIFSVTVGRADDTFQLNDGDRVVFYGDSITDQRLYTTFVETYVVTRFPGRNIAFTHSGWGGDRVTGGGGGDIDVRLQRDVFAYKPTVVSIMLGMNDGGYQAFDQRVFETYINGLASIVNKIRTAQPTTRVTLIQPSPYDDVTRAPTFPGGYNSVLVRYGTAVKELAQKQGLNVADLNSPVVTMLERAKASNTNLAAKIIPDRVHPGLSGHLIMAEALLKSWNAPAIVTDVKLDAGNGSLRVVRNTATNISALKTEGPVLTWTQLDSALPMPVDLSVAETALAVSSSDFELALNQEILQVSNLPEAVYELKIDDMPIGAFTREQFAEGINLAMRQTPMSTQAAAVHKLTLARTGLHQTRWRAIQIPLSEPRSVELKNAMPTILAALDAEEIATVIAQHAAARPVSHRYVMTPQSMHTDEKHAK
ncbi:MAG: SGNH/GDSL hydrolase family protein [Nibricoccus sp.]